MAQIITGLSLTDQEVGASNDSLFPAFDMQHQDTGPFPPLPTDDCPGVVLGTGTVFGQNAADGTFSYDPGSQCPQAGEDPIDVAILFIVTADLGNGCQCKVPIWACLTIQPAEANCDGFTPSPITTQWTCDNKLTPVSAALILSGLPGGASITSITPGGANPASGTFTASNSTGLTAYQPTQAELDAATADANGTETVCFIAVIAGSGATAGCEGTRKINVVISDPCANVEFSNVDFTN